MSAPKLEDQFTDARIIESLARLRGKEGKKLHDKQFLRNISKVAKKPTKRHQVFRLLPPRSLWTRVGQQRRARMSSVDATVEMSGRAALRYYNDPAHYFDDWAIRLRGFMEQVRARVLLPESAKPINPPRIHPQEKNKSKHLYRPIASFSLEDRIILSHVNRYLRDVFDDDFAQHSYAFRKPRRDIEWSHHKAALDLRTFRLGYEGTQPLWVAECDIQGFYDCVDHEIARASYRKFCDMAAVRGVTIDSRATKVFEAYLTSYSFEYAKSSAQGWFDRNDPDGRFKWPEDALKMLRGSDTLENVGVPQGGALSCLIANLVLHDADLVVGGLLSTESEHGFYARYCDDMVVVHTQREACQQLYNAYNIALQTLLLPAHAPSPPQSVYGKIHWNDDIKSRAPYPWASKNDAEHCPWVAFVGYHVRFDGLMRVRPKSLVKEIKKQVTVSDGVIGAATTSPRRTNKQILYRLRQKLLSMSVGPVSLDSLGPDDEPSFCWAYGFRGLRNVEFCTTHLRALDRARGQQVARVWRRLKKTKNSSTSSSTNSADGPSYTGRPFSYEAAFLGRMSVRRQRMRNSVEANTLLDASVDDGTDGSPQPVVGDLTVAAQAQPVEASAAGPTASSLPVTAIGQASTNATRGSSIEDDQE